MYRKRGEEGEKGNKMVVSLARLVDSILKHSRGSPLHIVFITDQESKDQVHRGLLEDLLSLEFCETAKNTHSLA